MSLVAYIMAMAAVFGAVALAVIGLWPAPAASVSGGRSALVQYTDLSRLPLFLRLLHPFLRAFGPLTGAIGWPTYRAKAARELERAGIADIFGVEHVLAFKILAAVVVPLLLSMVVAVVRNPAVFVLVAAGAFFLPDRVIADVRKARERAIVRALPGTVDVLSLSVEAGLEFLMAIQRVVERGAAGPLRDELAIVLNDIRLGKSRAEALKAFAGRIEVPEVSSFVSVLVQADALGASIGPVLLSQGERMRLDRFQRAEKEGAKASQKILFPLVLFIFPAVLIIIMGPVVLQYIYGR
jgi:tight adherence protein C